MTAAPAASAEDLRERRQRRHPGRPPLCLQMLSVGPLEDLLTRVPRRHLGASKQLLEFKVDQLSLHALNLRDQGAHLLDGR